jgi:cell division protein YceG involved in septum cleavage
VAVGGVDSSCQRRRGLVAGLLRARHRCRRPAPRRWNGPTFSVTLLLILLLSFGSILSYAKSSKEEVPVYKYYKSIEIKSGETMSSIADQYLSDEYDSKEQYINEVIQINALKEDIIHNGQYLIIPYYSQEFK